MEKQDKIKGAGKLAVRVLDQEGKPIDNDVVVLIMEHKPQFANQIRLEGMGRSPLTTELGVGLYSVQAAAEGRDVSRTLVRINPRETAELSLLLPPKEYEPVPLELRLEQYGIDASRTKPQPLVLDEKQRVVLDYKSFYDRRCYVVLKPKTIDDLKRWIGTPDETFGHDQPRFGPVPKIEVRPKGQYSPQEEQALWAIAREYIHGNSKAVAEFALPINTLLGRRLDTIVAVFFFTDVTINAGARLEIGKNSNAFTCNVLNIHQNGILAVVGDVRADIGLYRVFG